MANAHTTKGNFAVKTFKIAAAAGLLAASLTGAAWAQDASGAMAPAPAPGAPMTDSSQPAMTPPMAPSADTSAANSNATVTETTVTNGPVPDTAANRAKYGAPMSHAGKKTKPAGN